jgi:hypothetical protein
MNTNQETESVLSLRRVKWAGLAAFIGCAACCALPLLAVALAGTGASATIASFVRPGSEFIVGGAVFAVVLGALAIRSRMKAGSGCSSSCKADASCCEETSTPRSV